MSHSCGASICIDKPQLSKLSQTMSMSNMFKQTEEEKLYPERPLYRTEYGRMTWKVFHRIAAMYNQTPSEEDKKLIMDTFKGLSLFFPCEECAIHFQKEIALDPPKIEDNKSLSKWLCIQHNNVNKRIGKSLFNCDNLDVLMSEYKL
jgi:FAD-linked sulfhydryl oxidase